ncbi:hypothetical protein D3C87_956570 [compost metagenome]
MDRNEDVRVEVVAHGHAGAKLDLHVVRAGHLDFHPGIAHELLELEREGEGDILFFGAMGADAAGILAAVAGVDGDALALVLVVECRVHGLGNGRSGGGFDRFGSRGGGGHRGARGNGGAGGRHGDHDRALGRGGAHGEAHVLVEFDHDAKGVVALGDGADAGDQAVIHVERVARQVDRATDDVEDQAIAARRPDEAVGDLAVGGEGELPALADALEAEAGFAVLERGLGVARGLGGGALGGAEGPAVGEGLVLPLLVAAGGVDDQADGRALLEEACLPDAELGGFERAVLQLGGEGHAGKVVDGAASFLDLGLLGRGDRARGAEDEAIALHGEAGHLPGGGGFRGGSLGLPSGIAGRLLSGLSLGLGRARLGIRRRRRGALGVEVEGQAVILVADLEEVVREGGVLVQVEDHADGAHVPLGDAHAGDGRVGDGGDLDGGAAVAGVREVHHPAMRADQVEGARSEGAVGEDDEALAGFVVADQPDERAGGPGGPVAHAAE